MNVHTAMRSSLLKIIKVFHGRWSVFGKCQDVVNLTQCIVFVLLTAPVILSQCVL